MQRRRPRHVGDLLERVRMGLAHERVTQHPDSDLVHSAIVRIRPLRRRSRCGRRRQVGHSLDRRHQPEADPGRPRVAEGRSRCRREPRPGACRRLRAPLRDRARLRLVRGPAGRSGDRGGLHPTAEHAARRVVDPGARGREARALREAALAPPGRCRRCLRRGRALRPVPDGGVHVPPQPADEAADGADRRRRDRRPAPRPLDVLLLPLRRGQHPPAPRARGRRADGRRLLLRQRLTAARRRARVGLCAGLVRPDRHGLDAHRDAPLPR